MIYCQIKQVNRLATTFLLSCCLVTAAQAKEAEVLPEFRFGPEWTFSALDGGELHNQTYFDYLDYLQEKLVDQPPALEKYVLIDNEFYSPRGWTFHPTFDWGSIEVKAQPMTVAELATHKDEIQAAVFDSAWEIKTMPALFRGGGHLNVSGAPFSDDPLFFRNFIVDMLNHNELWYGIFNYDPMNATPFELLDTYRQKKILDSLNEVDRAPKNQKTHKLIQLGVDLGSTMVGKKIFINLVGLGLVHSGSRRLEIRAFRPQLSADVYYRQVRLLNARLQHIYKISQRGESIKLQPRLLITPNLQQQIDSELNGLFINSSEPPVDAQMALKAFYDFVLESGEKWSDHRDYIWPKWRNKGDELEKFEKSTWFRMRQSKVRCVEVLR